MGRGAFSRTVYARDMAGLLPSDYKARDRVVALLDRWGEPAFQLDIAVPALAYADLTPYDARVVERAHRLVIVHNAVVCAVDGGGRAYGMPRASGACALEAHLLLQLAVLVDERLHRFFGSDMYRLVRCLSGFWCEHSGMFFEHARPVMAKLCREREAGYHGSSSTTAARGASLLEVLLCASVDDVA